MKHFVELKPLISEECIINIYFILLQYTTRYFPFLFLSGLFLKIRKYLENIRKIGWPILTKKVIALVFFCGFFLIRFLQPQKRKTFWKWQLFDNDNNGRRKRAKFYYNNQCAKKRCNLDKAKAPLFLKFSMHEEKFQKIL